LPEIISIARYYREIMRKGTSGDSTILSSNALYCWRESLKDSFGLIIVGQNLKSAYISNYIPQKIIVTCNKRRALVLAEFLKNTPNHFMRHNDANVQKLISS
jgi:hypothetical protein